MENNEIKNLDIQGNCTYIISLIETSKSSTLKAINSELIILYWKIGEYIQKDILDKADKIYGENIVVELSKRLTSHYGRGFSKSGLSRMINFYRKFKDFEIVATLSQQLSWSHFVELIKIENELKREFYVAMTINEGWSVRVFKDRINSMLFERTAISKKPEETIKKDLKLLSNQKIMTESLFIKDPYILDFLGLEDSYSEKDLEDRILQELEKFLLEFGSDFAFMGRQKRIQIGNKDYYLDLLFYHRKMRRLVLIELKLGEFEPQYKGQVELYLKWLSKYEKQEFEEEPIAIILCASKDSEEIELLGLTEGNIRVSEYLASLPPKKLLEEKLHKAIIEAKELVTQK
ncbi:PDDEXK nuclease domain-containing protein [Candidatus Cetobacterium colombiensis]|uniref:PDDEXK nuclease domain-containing protein n=1 Tax=Candidatus Cetobacterium colombiensis TaxID=3073100 RepID=A0ABU4WGA3_9FUSO|nr:PDDEXK nuclease domain-containing protein [Candidatus Cetobacterium colombiensis]MDX8337405.1 PDDEXK nuclease domain-containing protein [Candidatus Cetobacterium colombiensis]